MKFLANGDDQSKRLDIYLVDKIPKLSRSSIQKLCEQEKVLINGQPQKSNYKLKSKDKIEVLFNSNKPEVIPDIKLETIYEDDDCVVINKPIGVLTHSKGAFNPEATVATFISNRTNSMDGDRAGIVHRLDRATSGVIICAKTPEALSWLQKQFSQRKVKKTYIAKVAGMMDPPEAIIDMPIERNPKKPQTFRVGSNGKPATTHYKTIKKGTGYSLVELKPQTGRTHQLRVHLAAQNHPIVGDELYSGEKSTRLFLHALELEITLPNKERKIFRVDLPDEFKELD